MTRKAPGRHFRKGRDHRVSEQRGHVGQQVSELTIEGLSGGSVPPHNVVEAERWS